MRKFHRRGKVNIVGMLANHLRSAVCVSGRLPEYLKLEFIRVRTTEV